MPYHRDLDRLEKKLADEHRLGTTGRGVGPAYVDKIAVTASAAADLADGSRLRERLEAVVPRKSALCKSCTATRLYGGRSVRLLHALRRAASFRCSSIAGELVDDALAVRTQSAV